MCSSYLGPRPWEKTRRRPERIERAREDESTRPRSSERALLRWDTTTPERGEADATERAALGDGANAVQSGPNATKRCVVQSPCSQLPANDSIDRISLPSPQFWPWSPQSPEKRLQAGIGVPSPAAADPLPPRPSLTARRRPPLAPRCTFSRCGGLLFSIFRMLCPLLLTPPSPTSPHTHKRAAWAASQFLGAGGTVRVFVWTWAFGRWGLGRWEEGGRAKPTRSQPTHTRPKPIQSIQSIDFGRGHIHTRRPPPHAEPDQSRFGGKRRLCVDGWVGTDGPAASASALQPPKGRRGLLSPQRTSPNPQPHNTKPKTKSPAVASIDPAVGRGLAHRRPPLPRTVPSPAGPFASLCP